MVLEHAKGYSIEPMVGGVGRGDIGYVRLLDNINKNNILRICQLPNHMIFLHARYDLKW
jgi:hypothetical protein